MGELIMESHRLTKTETRTHRCSGKIDCMFVRLKFLMFFSARFCTVLGCIRSLRGAVSWRCANNSRTNWRYRPAHRPLCARDDEMQISSRWVSNTVQRIMSSQHQQRRAGYRNGILCIKFLAISQSENLKFDHQKRISIFMANIFYCWRVLATLSLWIQGISSRNQRVRAKIEVAREKISNFNLSKSNLTRAFSISSRVCYLFSRFCSASYKSKPRILLTCSAHFVLFADITQAHKNRQICSLIGVEGGHSLGGSLGVLRTFYSLGVRYMTLTSTCHTPWADSSNADAPKYDVKHGGLTAYGKVSWLLFINNSHCLKTVGWYVRKLERWKTKRLFESSVDRPSR